MSHLRLRLCIAVAALMALAGAGNALAASSGLVISQVYGGGGNSGASFTNDYVELLNRGSAPVSTSGLSVQYGSAANNFSQVTVLPSAMVAPGGYFLVQLASGGAAGAPLPTADATGTTNLSATTGKVALVPGSTALACGTAANRCPASSYVDLVGFGGSSDFEGTLAPAPSNTTAILRENAGCVDTDDNGDDFVAGPGTPRTSASPTVVCDDEPVDQAPTVTSTVPTAGAAGVTRNATIAVTFSEPVTVADGWHMISCALTGLHAATSSGGPSAFLLDPIIDFAYAETCTVTIAGSAVTDQDGSPQSMEANYVFSFTTEAESTPPGDDTGVAISEVYGGGGNSGATYTHDFIELYNRAATSVGLSGWSVQYASSAGSSWQVTPLTGSIPAGRNYLVQEAAGAGGTTALPTPDASGGIAMAAGSGKVALVASTTPLSGACPTGPQIVDFVGYGSANCSETAPTAVLTNATSAQRKDGGAQDTNNNANDFEVGAPDPHASADQAPNVASTTPTAGAAGVARNANVTLVFSEPVNVAGAWFTIDCVTSGAHTAAVSGGPTTFVLDPATNFAADELCTVTVLAAQVTDVDADDPPDAMAANHTFTFRTIETTVCGDPATPIHAIQGSGATAALTGSRTIEGVVVGDYQAAGQFNGYFVQEEVADQDNDPLTSEGIFVFSGSNTDNVSAGDVVRVRGNAGEFGGMTQLSSITSLELCATGASVPATPVSLPVTDVSDHERYEGMLVRYTQTLTATEVFNLGRFGEVSLSGAGRLYNPTAVAAPGAPAQAVGDQNDRSRIILDDANNTQNLDPTLYPLGGLSATNTLRVGDTLPGLTGILEFRFSAYRIQPVGPVEFAATNLRTAAPADVGGNLKVASFNVLNYFNGDGLGGGFPTSRGAESQFELDRQEAKLVSALIAIDADVVGLMEIENDSGPNSALAQLVAALNEATAPGTYAAIDTGVIGTDEIAVALIYKPAAAAPVGDWQILTSADDPRFDDTRSRPALAQTFLHLGSGQALTVVVNHLKSKGSGCGPVDDQPDESGGNCNGTRTLAAAALADWLASDPTGSGDPDFMVIGDLNAYTFETPITTLEDAGYTNLVRQFGGLEAYSYVFDGESGYLDHALATSSLTAQVTGTTIWHTNPDEPTVLDYNVNFKSANHVQTLYDDGPYRASDHDPVIVGAQLTVTFASLCTLTRFHVTNPGIANSLCSKLAAAEAADARGDENAKRGFLGAYVNQLEAQSGKSLTAEAAAQLAALAATL